MSDNNIPIKSEVLLFLGTAEDKEHAWRLKPLVSNATVFTVYTPVSTLIEIVTYCKKRNITGVICTQQLVLEKLLAAMGKDFSRTKPSLDNYQGSYFQHQGIEIVFISPLKQLITVPYGTFIAKRFISKLACPATWNLVPAFNWEMLHEGNYEAIFQRYQNAVMVAVDIETLKDPVSIRCIGYTALFVDSISGKLTTHSCVLPINNMFAVSIMRKFNWELKAPKALQNGKYDCSYLAMYNASLYNYLWDTANMFHCWYAELPKDLAFLFSFFVRKSMYWKDLADTDDTMEYYRYNALDTHGTVLVVIMWILQAPEWAKRNYRQEFPLVFPCHMSEMTGIKRDMQLLPAVSEKAEQGITEENIKLSKMLGTYPHIFNTNSAPQNKNLRKVLGCEDILSSDDKSLKKIGNRHPLNLVIAIQILKIRKARKLVSTYLTVGDKAKEFKYERILYSINPHATDTGRNASKEHHFWCGLNIQNITRGKIVKQTLISDEGFVLAEDDLKQAETRDTAYISGDAALIAAINSPRDFHALNASAFFGVSYDKIFNDSSGKTLDKALRDLSKRVNHGANYLMGVSVLIDTMGEDKVLEAKKLLGLPSHYDLRAVATHLLAAFHATYPSLSASYYPAVVHEVMTTKMLVSHTSIRMPAVYDEKCVYVSDAEWELEPLEGWTRYCFGNPNENKTDKNAYVAHVSQSLNAMSLNVAYLRVFYEIALHPKHRDNFKLLAQIHDSILFQFRIGHEYLADMVRERMEIPIRILSYDGVERKFTVPADIKAGEDGKGALRWSETE